MIRPGLAACICTYKRTPLLLQLIDDIFKQTSLPQFLIVVDGFPQGDAWPALQSKKFSGSITMVYLPSNYPNLAFQRYLGWRIAQQLQAKLLLYFDDDLRLANPRSVEILMEPLSWPGHSVAGVTALTTNGNPSLLQAEKILLERGNGSASWIVRSFGASRHEEPGAITPTGNRLLPKPSSEHPNYGQVLWMQGRVMLYPMETITRECFSDDLFAITHIHCGLGEDTVLSKRVLSHGELWCSLSSDIEHPDLDLPNSYPIKAYTLGFATSYSRRLINDNHRFPLPPQWDDRMSLLLSYLGNNIINWSRALSSAKSYRFAYAAGYFVGSLRGLIQKPTAKNLTPHVNWWNDAENAILNQKRLI